MTSRADTPAGPVAAPRRKVGFATALYGSVGGLLICLATNDIIRGVQGAGVGLLTIVSLAGGTMLIHAAVRLFMGERRR